MDTFAENVFLGLQEDSNFLKYDIVHNRNFYKKVQQREPRMFIQNLNKSLVQVVKPEQKNQAFIEKQARELVGQIVHFGKDNPYYKLRLLFGNKKKSFAEFTDTQKDQLLALLEKYIYDYQPALVNNTYDNLPLILEAIQNETEYARDWMYGARSQVVFPKVGSDRDTATQLNGTGGSRRGMNPKNNGTRWK